MNLFLVLSVLTSLALFTNAAEERAGTPVKPVAAPAKPAAAPAAPVKPAAAPAKPAAAPAAPAKPTAAPAKPAAAPAAPAKPAAAPAPAPAKPAVAPAKPASPPAAPAKPAVAPPAKPASAPSPPAEKPGRGDKPTEPMSCKRAKKMQRAGLNYECRLNNTVDIAITQIVNKMLDSKKCRFDEDSFAALEPFVKIDDEDLPKVCFWSGLNDESFNYVDNTRDCMRIESTVMGRYLVKHYPNGYFKDNCITTPAKNNLSPGCLGWVNQAGTTPEEKACKWDWVGTMDAGKIKGASILWGLWHFSSRTFAKQYEKYVADQKKKTPMRMKSFYSVGGNFANTDIVGGVFAIAELPQVQSIDAVTITIVDDPNVRKDLAEAAKKKNEDPANKGNPPVSPTFYNCGHAKARELMEKTISGHMKWTWKTDANGLPHPDNKVKCEDHCLKKDACLVKDTTTP